MDHAEGHLRHGIAAAPPVADTTYDGPINPEFPLLNTVNR